MATRRTIKELMGVFGRTQDLIKAALVADSLYVVRTLDDLPDPVGDEVILPANKTVLFCGTLNLGSDALRLSTGTLPRGLGGDLIISSNTNGVIRTTDLGAAVVMREFSVYATAGPIFDLQGPIDYQLNCFFMGLLGADVGTVTGFDVQAFKDCFYNTADGIKHAGTTNKIFHSRSPFYGLGAGKAAITLEAGLNARRVDLDVNFFKHHADAVAIRAEEGYTVVSGRVAGSMSEGPTTMLDGLSSSDDNWWFERNDSIINSRVVAQSYLTEGATTPIATQGVFVPVTGPFSVSDLTQRLETNVDNELVYTGVDPVSITFNAAFTVNPTNNNRLAFRATKNGATLDYSETIIVQGQGAGASPQVGAVVAIIELVQGDRVGLAVANMTNTDDVPWLSATYAVKSG